MLKPLLAPGVPPRAFWAWAMYDFANSSYTTVVATAIFSAYFVATVAGNATWATLAFTAAVSAASALVLVLAPLVGALSDASGKRKRSLAVATALCVLGTAGLSAVGTGDVALGLALLMVSLVGFSLGEGLIAAWLPEIGRPEALGRLSGFGWATGYVGGLLSLGLCLLLIENAPTVGWSTNGAVQACMAMTAGFFLLAALPSFLILRDPQPGRDQTAGVAAAWQRIRDTWNRSEQLTDLRWLLLSIVVYQSGIAVVISLAAIYAQQAMGFDTAQTIQLVLLVNLTAAVGAFGFGAVQDRIGHRQALQLTLLAWLGMIGCAYLATTPGLFWVAANLAGLALGASQSAARALVGMLAPADRSGEYFGLWSLAVRLATIIGPISYGLSNWLLDGNHRLSMLATGTYFLVGIALLAMVDVSRGRQAAASSPYTSAA